MRRLPQLPRRWQHIGIGAGRFIGTAALQGLGAFAVAFTAYAVADTVPDGMWRTVTQVAVVVTAVGICAFAMWIKTRGDGRRRNQSSGSQVHNLSSKVLNWRFRRG